MYSFLYFICSFRYINIKGMSPNLSVFSLLCQLYSYCVLCTLYNATFMSPAHYIVISFLYYVISSVCIVTGVNTCISLLCHLCSLTEFDRTEGDTQKNFILIFLQSCQYTYFICKTRTCSLMYSLFYITCTLMYSLSHTVKTKEYNFWQMRSKEPGTYEYLFPSTVTSNLKNVQHYEAFL